MDTYSRINWQNGSPHTPLSAENLNQMDKAIYDLNQAYTSCKMLDYSSGSVINLLSKTEWDKIKNAKMVLFAGYAYGYSGVHLYISFSPFVIRANFQETNPFVVFGNIKNSNGEIHDSVVCLWENGNGQLQWYKQRPADATSFGVSDNEFKVETIYYWE